MKVEVVTVPNTTDDARPSMGVRGHCDLVEVARSPLATRQSVEIAKLTEALSAYGQHNAGCSARFGAAYRCRCGWRETAAALGVREGEGEK